MLVLLRVLLRLLIVLHLLVLRGLRVDMYAKGLARSLAFLNLVLLLSLRFLRVLRVLKIAAHLLVVSVHHRFS